MMAQHRLSNVGVEKVSTCPKTTPCLDSGAGILPAMLFQQAGWKPAPLLTTILILNRP